MRIDLVFNNRDMIHYLELRGDAIKNQNTELVRMIEDNIENLKMKSYQAEIVGAYVIFENKRDLEESIYMFRNNLDIHTLFHNNGISIEKASNPANIKWKNVHFSQKDRLLRAAVVSLFILALFTLSYFL